MFSNSVRELNFPVMLKASDNIHTSRHAGKKMVIARSKDELIGQYHAMEDGSNPSLMIQEYIPGRDDSVWMLNGYFDEHSECLFSITAKEDSSDACVHGHDRAWNLPSESGDRIGHERLWSRRSGTRGSSISATGTTHVTARTNFST